MILSGCASTSRIAPGSARSEAKTASASPIAPPETAEDNPLLNRHKILTHVMLWMGTPYDFSGVDSTGIDCSGFTYRIYHDAVGYSLPHSCRDQFALGAAVDREHLKFGDLVFFNTKGSGPSHVGIYVGDGLFAHAGTSLGVTISLLESAYFRSHFIGARRILAR